ncbi:hypothetical protein ACFWA5_11410 [Streptomyces mirabilis]
MPWNGGGMLPEAQTTFFAAAALWFPLTAVSRQPSAVSRQPSAVNGSSN